MILTLKNKAYDLRVQYFREEKKCIIDETHFLHLMRF